MIFPHTLDLEYLTPLRGSVVDTHLFPGVPHVLFGDVISLNPEGQCWLVSVMSSWAIYIQPPLLLQYLLHGHVIVAYPVPVF